MKIITCAVIKGGTGKTSTVLSLAQAAVKDRAKVLCIDLDPQASLTNALRGTQTAPGSADILAGEEAAGLIQKTAQGIDLISGSADLATVKTSAGSARRLQAALEPIKKAYKLILIDTPPALNDLTFNALQASTSLIIPLEADSFSLQGLYQITDIAAQIRQSNPALHIAGTVITRYDDRPKLNRYLRDVISEKGAEIGAPLLAVIRKGISLAEAAAVGKSLFDYAPNSKPAQDYRELYEIVKKIH